MLCETRNSRERRLLALEVLTIWLPCRTPVVRCEVTAKRRLDRVTRMNSGRPATLFIWLECESCGRIEQTTHEFNYPADMAEDMQLFMSMPCERCGRQAKLHMKRALSGGRFPDQRLGVRAVSS